jgi:hypothetical protein
VKESRCGVKRLSQPAFAAPQRKWPLPASSPTRTAGKDRLYRACGVRRPSRVNFPFMAAESALKRIFFLAYRSFGAKGRAQRRSRIVIDLYSHVSKPFMKRLAILRNANILRR